MHFSFVQNNLSAILPVILWVCALCFALMPVFSQEALFFLLSFLILLVALGLNIWTGGFEKTITVSRSGAGLMGFGFAFWALALVSVLLSEAPYDSFVYFCFFSALPLSFLLFVRLCEFRWMPALMIKIGAAFFLVLCVGYLAHYIVRVDLRSTGIVAWPLVNPNNMAALMSLGFFGCVGVLIHGRGKIAVWGAAAMGGLLLAAMETTGSKAGLAALLCGMAILIALDFDSFKAHWRRALALCAWGFFASLAINILAYGGLFRIPFLNASVAFGGDESLLARYEIWGAALNIARDHLWSGTGIGTFFLYYPEYRLGDFSSAGLKVHNDPLQFLVEMGIFAPVFFYGFLGVALWRVYGVLFRLQRDDPRRPFIVVPLCALGVMVVHAHMSFHFYVLAILTVAGAMLGVLFRSSEDVLASDASVRKFVFNVPGGIDLRNPICVALAVLGGFFFIWQSAEVLMVRAKYSMVAGNFDGFVYAVNEAGKITGQKSPRALVMASSVTLGVLEERRAFLSRKEVQGLYDTGLDQLDAAERSNPRLAAIYYMRSRYEALTQGIIDNPRQIDIEEMLRKALRIDPKHMEARIMLAKIYEARGDKKAALTLMKEHLPLLHYNNDPMPYIVFLTQLALDEGDAETHAQALAWYKHMSAPVSP